MAQAMRSDADAGRSAEARAPLPGRARRAPAFPIGAARPSLRSPMALRTLPPRPPKCYFAAAGNAGSLPMSRMSCWMTTVALRFATICFMRSIEATVAARSKLKLGTPPLS